MENFCHKTLFSVVVISHRGNVHPFHRCGDSAEAQSRYRLYQSPTLLFFGTDCISQNGLSEAVVTNISQIVIPQKFVSGPHEFLHGPQRRSRAAVCSVGAVHLAVLFLWHLRIGTCFHKCRNRGGEGLAIRTSVLKCFHL